MHKRLVIETTKCNLASLQPEMEHTLKGDEHMHMEDITEKCNTFLAGKDEGMLFISTLHTTTSLMVNEMHEPMVVLDMYRKLEEMVPNGITQYFHNSKYRTKNLDACDSTCDTNGAAHVKCMILGNSHLWLPFAGGKLLLGKWQRIALLDFDGPRTREVVLSVR